MRCQAMPGDASWWISIYPTCVALSPDSDPTAMQHSQLTSFTTLDFSNVAPAHYIFLGFFALQLLHYTWTQSTDSDLAAVSRWGCAECDDASEEEISGPRKRRRQPTRRVVISKTKEAARVIGL